MEASEGKGSSNLPEISTSSLFQPWLRLLVVGITQYWAVFLIPLSVAGWWITVGQDCVSLIHHPFCHIGSSLNKWVKEQMNE